MNHSAPASNVSSVILKMFFASILLALILSPVISAGGQDSTQPKIKKRILRVERQPTGEPAKTKRAETQQQTQQTTAENNVATAIPCESILFLSDVESVILFASGYQPNSTVIFTTVQTNPGVVGFSGTPTGPFVESYQFPITMDGSGSGISSSYYVKGLMVGFTTHHDTSPETVAYTTIDYNVINHCNCPPIPVVP
ncbi:MAG TPA: hypothetical protein VJ875_16190 [Pyrinomonadaceae bacterium]|nr:hypothetical protein [Pyrinomonadaceae bacterium]